jgi:hypothetical protein
MDKMKFIYWEMASNDTIDFKKVYVDMADDLIAGLLLSQIVYWHLPSKESGNSKMKVEREGELWIAKGREDWHEEIRISAKQYDRAIKILENKDLVVVKTFKFDGNPMKHVRLNWNHFLAFLEYQLEVNAMEIDGEPYSPMVIPQRVKTNLPKGEKGNSPKGKKEIAQRSITSYTENTHIDNNIDYFVNKGFTIDEMLECANVLYSNFAPGRWSKDDWNTITTKLLNDLLDEDGMFRKSDSPAVYLHGCYKQIAHHHDLKTGKKQFKPSDAKIPFYDWLNE